MTTLTLPSTASSRRFPTNTVATYRTRLSEPINLKGNSEYEVALTEIQFPSLISTAHDCWVWAEKPGFKSPQVFLTRGHYKNEDVFVAELTRALRETTCRFAVSASSISRLITITFEEKCILHMSHNLSQILGFDFVRLENFNRQPTTFTAQQPFDVYRGLGQIFVYCDICSDVTLGDTRAPLLRVINSKAGYSTGGSYEQCVSFTKPVYAPISIRNIDTILVYLRLSTGKPVPFMSGSVIVTLSLRRRLIHSSLKF